MAMEETTIRSAVEAIIESSDAILNTPFVLIIINNPLDLAYLRISMKSGRKTGSPPKKTDRGDSHL